MDTERAVERLIFFTDAVSAIAITLLILPLVEIVTTFANQHRTVEAFLHDNVTQMFAFALSFVVIARVWMANHEILADTMRVTVTLMWLDIAWVFTVVLIPLPTEITAAFKSSELTVIIYTATFAASTILLFAMAVYLYLHPKLQSVPTSRVLLWGVGSNMVGFTLALVLVLLVPAVGYYGMLLPALTIPLDRIVKPGIARREAARTAS